jgi:hypothetical protein
MKRLKLNSRGVQVILTNTWRSHGGDESDGLGPEAVLGDEALKKIEVCHEEREGEPAIKTIRRKSKTSLFGFIIILYW